VHEQGISELMNEALIESAIAGEREALSLLWQSSRRWVATVLLAHKPRDADLEDLLQVVAMQMCRKISTVNEPKAFKSWLRTVAINAARQEGRKTSNRKRSMLRLVGLEHSNDRSPSPADVIAAESDESRKIYQAAMSLPMGYREPVLMRCVRSMSYQQIGEVLELPTTTIETRIARGRRMLREILAQQEREQHAERETVSSVSARGGAR
jgi:RNA polymerase sigma-70 factor, ECF subfamily